jgi:hypothetical protein
MERINSGLAKSASAWALFPILGLMGGILFGVIRVWIWRGDELRALGLIVQGGFFGSVFGAVAVFVFAVLERKNLASLKKMMGIILVVALLLWVVVMLLRDLVGSGVL